jgi:hypothetical protein
MRYTGAHDENDFYTARGSNLKFTGLTQNLGQL